MPTLLAGTANAARARPATAAEHPGDNAFVVDPNTAVAAVAEDLALTAGASLEHEFQDQVRDLPSAV